MRMVIIGHFQLKVFQCAAFAKSWHVFEAFANVSEKNVLHFCCHEHTSAPAQLVFVLFIFSLPRGVTSGVKVHSEAVGGPKITPNVREGIKKQAEHHRFTSTVSYYPLCV